ncbi:hypothetical protein ACQPZP_39585 [Spirillospora sp. CA-142024]|uniref:hypothetical protein n=1 Tax=Spirillospora sp. CA-142024 TaxID=3240036 RepID=UPI003D906D18
MAHVSDFLLDVARKVANDRTGEIFTEGFEEAANICMDVLSKNIDALLDQIKLGGNLSKQEQFLLSNLIEIKSETEKRLNQPAGAALERDHHEMEGGIRDS